MRGHIWKNERIAGRALRGRIIAKPVSWVNSIFPVSAEGYPIGGRGMYVSAEMLGF